MEGKSCLRDTKVNTAAATLAVMMDGFCKANIACVYVTDLVDPMLNQALGVRVKTGILNGAGEMFDASGDSRRID